MKQKGTKAIDFAKLTQWRMSMKQKGTKAIDFAKLWLIVIDFAKLWLIVVFPLPQGNRYRNSLNVVLFTTVEGWFSIIVGKGVEFLIVCCRFPSFLAAK